MSPPKPPSVPSANTKCPRPRGEDERRARQAEALRANLRRRKAAVRETPPGPGKGPRRPDRP